MLNSSHPFGKEKMGTGKYAIEPHELSLWARLDTKWQDLWKPCWLIINPYRKSIKCCLSGHTILSISSRELKLSCKNAIKGAGAVYRAIEKKTAILFSLFEPCKLQRQDDLTSNGFMAVRF